MQMTSENPKHETISLAEEHVFQAKPSIFRISSHFSYDHCAFLWSVLTTVFTRDNGRLMSTIMECLSRFIRVYVYTS